MKKNPLFAYGTLMVALYATDALAAYSAAFLMNSFYQSNPNPVNMAIGMLLWGGLYVFIHEFLKAVRGDLRGGNEQKKRKVEERKELVKKSKYR